MWQAGGRGAELTTVTGERQAPFKNVQGASPPRNESAGLCSTEHFTEQLCEMKALSWEVQDEGQSLEACPS